MTEVDSGPVAGPRVKGTLLSARKKYVESRGPEILEQVLARLSPEDRLHFARPVLPSSWYPLKLLRAFEAQIAAVLGHDSHTNLLLDIGRATAEANLTGNGTQRVYVRSGDPHFVLSRSPAVYASHFNIGSRTYEKKGDRSAVIRTTKPFEDAEHDACLITVGWLRRAIEIAGGKNPRVVETRCAAQGGAASCEIRCDWD